MKWVERIVFYLLVMVDATMVVALLAIYLGIIPVEGG